MKYSRRDLGSDVLFVGIIVLVGWGGYRVSAPPVKRLWRQAVERTERLRSPLPVGTPIDFQWDIKTLDGKTVPMASLKGKVLFLNFWASWCGPCRQENPSIESLYEKTKGTEVVFLCVANEDVTTLKSYLERKPMATPIYHVEMIPPAFKVTGIPATFIVGKDGKVALSRSGAVKWDKSEFRELLANLLRA